MEGHISQRQYAAERGCTEGAVRKAIAGGRIVHGVVRDEKGRPWINKAIADQEWSQNYNPNYAHNNEQLAQGLQVLPNEAPAAPKAPEKPADNSDEVAARASISKSKQLESQVKAKLLHIKLQEQTGQIVRKTDIANTLFEMGQEIRKTLVGIPARHIDKLRSIKDRNEAQIYLEEAIAAELEKLTQVIARDL